MQQLLRKQLKNKTACTKWITIFIIIFTTPITHKPAKSRYRPPAKWSKEMVDDITKDEYQKVAEEPVTELFTDH